jgi:CubicO group peptidase (beta-lactamase class C family)
VEVMRGLREQTADFRRIANGASVSSVIPRAVKRVPPVVADTTEDNSPGPTKRNARRSLNERAFSLGADTVTLNQHLLLCRRSLADACLVQYRGEIVQEWFGARYTGPTPAMSSTKGVTAVLVGMLIDDGKISSTDQRVCEFLRDWCSGIRGRVTLHHLLAMTSGLPNVPATGSVDFVHGDKNAHVRSMTPQKEPGTSWAYSNEGAQLLSPILDAAAGEPIERYASRRLFAPLGMSQTKLALDSVGHASTYADMSTVPRDLAKIGQLMLQRGRWRNVQIVSAEWVNRVVQPSQRFNETYGLLWSTWLPREQQYSARGYLDNSVWVIAKDSLVIVRMQRHSQESSKPAAYLPDAFYLFDDLLRRDDWWPG